MRILQGSRLARSAGAAELRFCCKYVHFLVMILLQGSGLALSAEAAELRSCGKCVAFFFVMIVR